MDSLTHVRKARGISRAELARLIGMDVETIGRYERGDREPKASTIVSLSRVLGCSIEDLLGVGKEDS